MRADDRTGGDAHREWHVYRVAFGTAMRTELKNRPGRTDEEVMGAVRRMFQLGDDCRVCVPADWRSC